MVLHFSGEILGPGAPASAAFAPTFLVIGLIPILAIAIFAQLKPGDGAEMTGRPSVAEPETPATRPGRAASSGR
jgi:hypothetical protein